MLMIRSDYKHAWKLISEIHLPSHELQFLKATCAMKLNEQEKAIAILTELKRNQMNRKVKVKALLLRMRALRKLQLYDQSLRDGMTAQALMTASD